MSGDETVFPTGLDAQEYVGQGGVVDRWAFIGGGLTKRELFAAMAMQGFAADPRFVATSVKSDPPVTAAKIAVLWADALLDELAKEKKP